MKKIFSIALGTLALVNLTFAQGGPGGPMGGQDFAWTKLFGDNAAFTARTEMTVTDKSGKGLSMFMNTWVLDQKARTEVNMAEMKSANIPPEAIAQMKQMGMDRVISIVRPDQKLLYIIYPGMKSYAKMPLTKPGDSTAEKKPKIEKTKLGEETLDGHPCVKNKVTMTGEDGKVHEFTTWNATDLKDFPIQLQTGENGNTILMRYTNIKFDKPAAALFDPPAGFTAYADMQQMMMSAMQKMMPPPGAQSQ